MYITCIKKRCSSCIRKNYDKCEGQGPQAYVEVYTNLKPGSSGVSEFWCIDCLREGKRRTS
jgi:hypothetical protein